MDEPKTYHKEPISKEEYPEFYTCLGDTCPPAWLVTLLVITIIVVPILVTWWVMG